MFHEDVGFTCFQLVQHIDETLDALLGGFFAKIKTRVADLMILQGIHIHHWQLVLGGYPSRHGFDCGIEARAVHVARNVTQVGDVFFGHFNLRPQFFFNVLDFPGIGHHRLLGVIGIGINHRVKIAIGVAQAGGIGEGSPLDVVPFAGDGKMEANVGTRILGQHYYRFREPGGRHNHFDGSLNAFAVTFDQGLVARMGITHVVAANNQAGRVAHFRCQDGFSNGPLVVVLVKNILKIQIEVISIQATNYFFGMGTFDVAQGKLDRFIVFPDIGTCYFVRTDADPIGLCTRYQIGAEFGGGSFDPLPESKGDAVQGSIGLQVQVGNVVDKIKTDLLQVFIAGKNAIVFAIQTGLSS